MTSLKKILDDAIRDGFRRALDGAKADPDDSEPSVASGPRIRRRPSLVDLEADSLGGRS